MSDALLFFVCLAAALCIRQFIACVAVVKGRSMLSTLHPRDVMLAVRLPLLYRHIRRGNIVLCRYPGRYWRNLRFVPQTFVKRVVGLPGDTVQISGGYLYVNDVKYTEKFLSARMYSDYGPYIVPEGHYFLMGDNRNNSNDSRSSHVGAVPRNMILGKVEAVLWHQIPSTLDDWGLAND